MSTPFYQSAERRAAFVLEAMSWVGTPFFENASVKGKYGGVDCVHLAAEVHFHCRALDRISIPKMPVQWIRNWHEHHAESQLLQFFGQPEVRSRLRRIEDGAPPMIGDVAVIRFGKTEHHVALWCDSLAVHVSTSAGVITVSTGDPEFTGRIRSFYRVFE